MTFEWDPKKDALNVRDHRLSFSVAKFAFSDPERWERYDEAHSDTEDRWQTLAMVGSVIFVVFTCEEEDVTRIISARVADAGERRIYYGERDPENWRKAD